MMVGWHLTILQLSHTNAKWSLDPRRADAEEELEITEQEDQIHPGRSRWIATGIRLQEEQYVR
jgi:hypothetical protein